MSQKKKHIFGKGNFIQHKLLIFLMSVVQHFHIHNYLYLLNYFFPFLNHFVQSAATHPMSDTVDDDEWACKKKGSTKLRTTSFWQENNISRSPPFQGCQSFDVDRLAHRAEPSGFWGQTQLVQPGLRHDMKWWVFKT